MAYGIQQVMVWPFIKKYLGSAGPDLVPPETRHMKSWNDGVCESVNMDASMNSDKFDGG